jgi:hypothetical protein
MAAKIILQVPYAEKDLAKPLGAKWDPTARTWHVEVKHGQTGYGLDKLTKWTRPADKRFLDCPQEHSALAERRGALRDQQTGRLFVPSWYADVHPQQNTLYRLSYWLPVCVEFRQPDPKGFRYLFPNALEAGRFMALNAPYTARELYLPGEREAMDRLCAISDHWYICSADPKSPYYRQRIWDTY